MLKMRGLILFVLATAAASAELVGIQRNYFDAVGIPLAREIKQYEDSLFLQTGNDNARLISPKIVGGVTAPIQSYPYMAGLVVAFTLNEPWGAACGASLLSSNKLVTAAHCWNDGRRQAVQFEVVFASQFLFYGGTRITTNWVFMHPQYNSQLYWNDVAMITLPTHVQLSAFIQPVALPSIFDMNQSFDGFIAVAAGYGRTNDLSTGVSTNTQLNHVSLQIIPLTQCRQRIVADFVQSWNICTNGIGGIGICGGDSGGPLIVNRNGIPTLVGISSWAAEVCLSQTPSGFSRVTSFYNFIVQNM